ncbi:MAG: hypothetical protein K2K33_10240 [Muribaculaceae bacterium]|nr:hypothetical protein [Muribaculaceae bacterium]MDE6610915.1 hypothetical protein [Muribaculaceae bacterium]
MMIRILYAAGVAVVMLLSGCKTTEANYKAAYETAREKNASTIGTEVDSAIAGEDSPKEQTFGDVVLPTIGRRLYAVKADGADSVNPKLYNVAVARFRQLFNARSLCARLREGGFEGAFLAMDKDRDYYVLTGTTSEAQEASVLLSETVASDVFKPKTPFPCVIVSR